MRSISLCLTHYDVENVLKVPYEKIKIEKDKSWNCTMCCREYARNYYQAQTQEKRKSSYQKNRHKRLARMNHDMFYSTPIIAPVKNNRKSINARRQYHALNLTDIYVKNRFVQNSENLKVKDIPDDVVELYRMAMLLRRTARKQKEESYE